MKVLIHAGVQRVLTYMRTDSTVEWMFFGENLLMKNMAGNIY